MSSKKSTIARLAVLLGAGLTIDQIAQSGSRSANVLPQKQTKSGITAKELKDLISSDPELQTMLRANVVVNQNITNSGSTSNNIIYPYYKDEFDFDEESCVQEVIEVDKNSVIYMGQNIYTMANGKPTFKYIIKDTVDSFIIRFSESGSNYFVAPEFVKEDGTPLMTGDGLISIQDYFDEWPDIKAFLLNGGELAYYINPDRSYFWFEYASSDSNWIGMSNLNSIVFNLYSYASYDKIINIDKSTLAINRIYTIINASELVGKIVTVNFGEIPNNYQTLSSFVIKRKSEEVIITAEQGEFKGSLQFFVDWSNNIIIV